MRSGDFEHDFVVCRGMEGAAGEHERIVGKRAVHPSDSAFVSRSIRGIFSEVR